VYFGLTVWHYTGVITSVSFVVAEGQTGGVRHRGVPKVRRRTEMWELSDETQDEWDDSPTERLGVLIDLFDEADEPEWQDRALCAQTDPEAFFPEKGGSTREAKRICQGCDVRSECLEYALAHDERFGIWGGLSERERRKLKKRAV
jgi:WhiB family transcriptional regulator, redox-sensing transcriptional regulator